MKQEELNRMRNCAQLILTTIRVAEKSGISNSEHFSAQNAIDAFFVLWKNNNQVFSDELKTEVHLALTHVFKKRKKRKDIYTYDKIEELLNLILKETESPRKYRGLIFIYDYLFFIM